jgi:hypothetical protein
LAPSREAAYPLIIARHCAIVGFQQFHSKSC